MRQFDRVSRHRVSELNRGGAAVLDEAADSGVIFDAHGRRPELLLAPLAEWERLQSLVEGTRVVADVMADVASLLRGDVREQPHVPWLSVLDREDLLAFAQDVTAAARLALATDNPSPLGEALFRWKSTAEYILAGAPLTQPPDWNEVVRLSRPADAAY